VAWMRGMVGTVSSVSFVWGVYRFPGRESVAVLWWLADNVIDENS
jgi:hypothetical protein